MLQLIPISSPNVVGMKLAGKVNHDDMTTVMHEVERKLERQDQLGIYIEMDHFKGFTLRGLIREMGLLTHHINHITRTALVSDKQWYKRSIAIITHWAPNVEIEHFTPLQRDEALIWACEQDVGAYSA
ncbi:STAS/SEC14 domain-containing protein [Spongiibacter nanhainus]|uniref:STAS/SEC14 domain-containing protein n=1 Tax=Spongiibacter nanhainus TaxID=2794344 RepID=A0A7T4R0T1_9GAMM|nr:STAS/SEC14 domain-containing protein [Spongiibacter nanhainus]QQD18331.1 STAS/SEC14 domain-containing protein [Spongiibacter nanhainus]